MDKRKPEENFRISPFEVSIWRNKFNDRISYSFTLKKNYKKDEEWHQQRISLFEEQIDQCIEVLKRSKMWFKDNKK